MRGPSPTAGGGWLVPADRDFTPSACAERLGDAARRSAGARQCRGRQRAWPRHGAMPTARLADSGRARCSTPPWRRSAGVRGMTSACRSTIGPHPFRRHRRHRHERHRRDPAQSRLSGAGLATSATAPTCSGCAGTGIPVAIGHAAENLGEARGRRGLLGGQARQSRARGGARAPAAGGAPRRHAGRADAPQVRRSRSAAPTARRRRPSMIAALLDAAELDPTVVNGGIINAYGTNARLGAGRLDGGRGRRERRQLPAPAGDHRRRHQHRPRALDHYGSFDAVRDAFQHFVEHMPFYGFAALCIDHPEVQALDRPASTDRRVVTYGFSPQADVRAVDVASRGRRRQVSTSSCATENRRGRATAGAAAALPMPGEHNVQNALAAIAVARELGIADDVVREALGRLRGRQAALHPHRHGRRRHHHRRLRPPSGRDRGRAARPPAPAAHGTRDRRRAAASLHAPARPVRGVLHLLQRRRHGAGGAGLRRRRAPDRGRRPRRAGRRPARPRPSRRARRSTARTIWRRWSRASPRPGDLVVCLGAGSITAVGQRAARASSRAPARRGAGAGDERRCAARSSACRRCAAACGRACRWRR